MSDTVRIVTAADEAYVPHVAAMLHSAFSSNPGERFEIRLLQRGAIPHDALARLGELCAAHGAAFADVVVPATALDGVPLGSRYRAEAWYRLCLPSLLPQHERALWIDADTLVLEPLRPLWDVALGEAPLAAVPNALSVRQRGHAGRLGMAPDRARYFNTGVMVLDLRRLRSERAEVRLREAAIAVHDHNLFADQDVFSLVFGERFLALPLGWNVTAGAFLNARENIRVHGLREYRRALRHPRIVHFTQQKPWLYTSSHPWRDRYLAHRAAAGWPAPAYEGVRWQRAILRRLPMAWRVLLTHPRRLGAADILWLGGIWLTQPTFRAQRSA